MTVDKNHLDQTEKFFFYMLPSKKAEHCTWRKQSCERKQKGMKVDSIRHLKQTPKGLWSTHYYLTDPGFIFNICPFLKWVRDLWWFILSRSFKNFLLFTILLLPNYIITVMVVYKLERSLSLDEMLKFHHLICTKLVSVIKKFMQLSFTWNFYLVVSHWQWQLTLLPPSCLQCNNLLRVFSLGQRDAASSHWSSCGEHACCSCWECVSRSEASKRLHWLIGRERPPSLNTAPSTHSPWLLLLLWWVSAY